MNPSATLAAAPPHRGSFPVPQIFSYRQTPALVPSVRVTLVEPSRGGTWQVEAGACPLDGASLTVRARSVVVVGADDPATTVEMARAIHQRIAGSEFAILKNAGHLSNREQEAFNRAVLGFPGRHCRLECPLSLNPMGARIDRFTDEMLRAYHAEWRRARRASAPGPRTPM